MINSIDEYFGDTQWIIERWEKRFQWWKQVDVNS